MRGVVWAGVRTEAFAETVAFFRDVLGVPLVELAPGFAWSKLEDSSQFEIFGLSSHRPLGLYDRPGPRVPLVDDLSAATAVLEAAGVEVPVRCRERPDQGWVHFRGPTERLRAHRRQSSYPTGHRRKGEASHA